MFAHYVADFRRALVYYQRESAHEISVNPREPIRHNIFHFSQITPQIFAELSQNISMNQQEPLAEGTKTQSEGKTTKPKETKKDNKI